MSVAGIVGFMSTLLEQSLGCTVTGLTSSTEALRRFQDDPYGVDMVIVDQTMPDLTGAELAARPDIPIVMNTGYSNTIDEDAAHRIGIRRFLVKPVPARILVDIVAECLGAKSIDDARAKPPTGTA